MPVILIRHGQSLGNLQRIFQGTLDFPLTELGRTQAASAGQWLAGRGLQFSTLYTSPLARAAQTAQILAGCCACTELREDSRLREIDGGALQGLTDEQCNERFPQYQSRGLPHTGDFSEYGGESYEQVNARLGEFIRMIQQAHTEPELVGIVAHGGSLYQLLKQWCGWPVPRHFFIAMGNCVLICLRQREVRGHLGAELAWMLPMELLDGSLTTEYRIADSPAAE